MRCREGGTGGNFRRSNEYFRQRASQTDEKHWQEKYAPADHFHMDERRRGVNGKGGEKEIFFFASFSVLKSLLFFFFIVFFVGLNNVSLPSCKCDRMLFLCGKSERNETHLILLPRKRHTTKAM